MGSVGPKRTIWQGLEWKIAAITVVLVAFFGVLIVRKMKEPPPRPAESMENPKPQPASRREAGKSPASNITGPDRPLYPMDSWSDYADPSGSRMSGRTITGQIPIDHSLGTGKEPYPSSSPTTQVHPLSEAGEVMGMPSSEVGTVGVTRTYRLPGETSGTGKNASATNPIGVPPGMDPGEAGKSKSYPLPKDPSQP